MAKTLQAQGVPVPSKLSGPQPGSVNGPNTRTANPAKVSRGSTPRRASGANAKSVGNRKSRSASRSHPITSSVDAYNKASPINAGNSVSGVGLLEAEFLCAILILILLMFSSDASMTDKMMSVMKRGTLLCAIFFVLALVAGVGPRASKSAKAFGALIIVAILVTSPMSTVLTDLDNIIKNDWIGVNPKDTKSGSADTGTGASSDASAIESQLQSQMGTLSTPFTSVDIPLVSNLITTLAGWGKGLGF